LGGLQIRGGLILLLRAVAGLQLGQAGLGLLDRGLGGALLLVARAVVGLLQLGGRGLEFGPELLALGLQLGPLELHQRPPPLPPRGPAPCPPARRLSTPPPPPGPRGCPAGAPPGGARRTSSKTRATPRRPVAPGRGPGSICASRGTSLHSPTAAPAQLVICPT